MDNKNLEWINEEKKSIEALQQSFTSFMKFEENTIYELEIDFNARPQRVADTFNPEKQRVKLQVVHAGVLKSWDLNPSNPIYKQLLDAAALGQTHFKVIKTGSKKETRYQLVR